MKNLKWIAVLVVCYLSVKCVDTQEDLLIEDPLKSQQLKGENKQQRNRNPWYSRSNVVYSKKELIVQFVKGISDTKKQRLRDYFKVQGYKSCRACEKGSVEKWIFGDDVDIEDKKLGMESDGPGMEGIESVDYEFKFTLEEMGNFNSTNSSNSNYSESIVSNNSGVTIAVLDTGVDTNYPLFNGPFLYKASSRNGCGDKSGWDFVNDDDNCYDDNFNIMHGTRVAYIIHENLRNKGVPHQILPVKVANESGRASYFNIICGLKYALPRADIVQMSLGWYAHNRVVNSILTKLIDQYSRNVLIVTSAGNANKNNDRRRVTHYPSSYPQENILAIAASNANNSGKAYFSNYGRTSVDFYAPGQNIPFYNYDGSVSLISGTSYAAPYATAIAAKVLYDSGMSYAPSQIISQLNISGDPTTGPYFKPVKYNKLLLMP